MASSNGSKRSSLHADLNHLRATFASVDPENTGYIGVQELRSLAQTSTGVDETTVALVLEKLDRDKDGKISFQDFQEIFKSERESIKRQRLEKSSRRLVSEDTDFGGFDPAVVLRLKKPPKLEFMEQSPKSDPELGNTMELGGASTDGQSPVEHDLATQMRYLTNIPESPRLNRTSKVLSWISESEDMFEGAGVSGEPIDELLSPPMSPKHVSGDDEVHVCSIVEAVCQTQEIGPDAVQKLCNHVQADEKEQQELLVLLNHLDKEEKGYVSVDEFVSGLQSMRASANVVSSTPPFLSHRKTQDMGSVPFSSTPKSSKRILVHTSTPLPLPWKSAVQGISSELTVLDPNNSGFVEVESLAQQWQGMGVEPPKDQSILDALKESLHVNASRHVSVSEITSILESAVVNDNRNATLRQAALVTFKGEINQLRQLLHQVSMERDGLQSSLQRATDESKRLVREGDEQLERITRETEIKAWENEQRLSERLREVERGKEEEAKRLQDLIDKQKERYQRDIEDMKSTEERLKKELKFTVDEAKRRNFQESLESEVGFGCDHSDKVTVKQDEALGIRSKLVELEQENAYLLEQTKNLQEENRSLQDRVDELMAENEMVKQKYTFHKRRLQRQHSAPHFSQLDGCSTSRPHSGKRVSSATRRATTVPSLGLISEGAYDTPSPVTTNSNGRDGLQEVAEHHVNEVDADMEAGYISSISSEDELFGKSTTSLLEEMQDEDTKSLIEKQLEKLQQEQQELKDSCVLLEEQFQQQEHRNDVEKRQLFFRHKHKLQDLRKQIQSLEEQKGRLSNTKEEIEIQLETMESNLLKQLSDIRTLQHWLETGGMGQNQRESITAAKHVPVEALISEGGESANTSLDYQNELQHKLDIMTSEKQKLLFAHEVEMQKTHSEAKKERKKCLKIENEHNRTIVRLQKELHSSQMALEQYKNDAQSLEVQLSVFQHEIKCKDKELKYLQERQQRKVLPIVPSHTLEDKELSRLEKQNERLLNEIQVKVAEIERIQGLLECQQEIYENELERQTQEKLERMRNDADSKATAVETRTTRELALCVKHHNIHVENDEQDMKASLKKFNDRVETAEKKSEDHLLQQNELVKLQQSEIEELQSKQIRAQEEISCIEREKQKLKSQLIEKINLEDHLRSDLEKVKSQLYQKQISVLEEQDVNSPVETQLMAKPVLSPNRQSVHSDNTFHAEIVAQMKEMLEDLQMCLVLQDSSSCKKNKLTLVHELLEANATLKENLEREQNERIKELVTLDEKDSRMEVTERENNYHLQRNHCLNSAVKNLERDIALLEHQLEACIHSFSEKIGAANASIAQLIERLKVNEEYSKHAQVSQAQFERDNYMYKADIPCDKQQQMYHHSLNVNELSVSEPSKFLVVAHSSLTTGDDVCEHFMLTHTDGKRRISSRSMTHVNHRNLTYENGAKEQVLGLYKNGERGKQQGAEIQSNMQKLTEEICHLKEDICIREREIVELQHKLETVVNEPVEVVVQYLDVTPQESRSDVLLAALQTDLKAGSHQGPQAVANHRTEHEPDQSKCKSMDFEDHSKHTWHEKHVTREDIRKSEKKKLQMEPKVIAETQNQLTSSTSEAEDLKTQLHAVYSRLALIPADTDQVDYSDLAQRAEDKIATLFRQVSEEQSLRHEIEIQMGKSQTEWQFHETQWLVEHEEEVRALKQRNMHLSQMLQNTHSQYHDYVADQQRENSEIVQDLITKQANLENELQLRTWQLSQNSSQKGGQSNMKKEVLLDIVDQLSTLWLTPLDDTL